MRKYSQSKNHEKGSALLIVMMMVIMLTILVMEISFSAQTAYSLAKNQIEKAQMNAVSETGFAYAYNIVQLKLDSNSQKTVNATGTTSSSATSATGGNMSIFAKAESLDGSVSAPLEGNGPAWKGDFQVVTIGNIHMKLKINLEECKININRLVNSEDKVDIRIRSALIDILKQFKGTEEDVDRIIDYIDVNTLGQYETSALNGPAQSIGEILAIPNISLKYTLDEEDEKPSEETPKPAENLSMEEKPLNLGDFLTVKSTGRININYAHEDILKSIINGQQERAILETILQGRSKEPFKTLNQLAFNKQFASTYKKIANYLTIDENTFKVKVILKAKDNTIARIYYGYLFCSIGAPQYILRTERIGGNDPELNADSKEIGEIEEIPSANAEEKEAIPKEAIPNDKVVEKK